MNYKKIKITSRGVELVYLNTRQLAEGVYVHTDVVEKSTDEPHPDFLAALQRLSEIAADDEGASKDDITMTGVTLYESQGAYRLTYMMQIISGKVVRNSGKIGEETDDLDYDRLVRLVNELKDEATAYRNGKRAQLTLFEETNGADDLPFSDPAEIEVDPEPVEPTKKGKLKKVV